MNYTSPARLGRFSRALLRLLAPLAMAAGAASATAGCVDTDNEVVFEASAAATASAPGAGLASGCDDTDATGGPRRLRGRVYSLPLETRQLPDFDALQPLGAICMNGLAVTERRGYPGFPGLRNRFEWFGVDFDGAFEVTEAGLYHFRLTSDDGSRLYLDGALAIDNDGFHVTRSAESAVYLQPGVHTVTVPYWQGPGPMALMLEVAPPGSGYEIFRVDRPLAGTPQ
jgi:hypothetical protein